MFGSFTSAIDAFMAYNAVDGVIAQISHARGMVENIEVTNDYSDKLYSMEVDLEEMLYDIQEELRYLQDNEEV